MHPNDYNCFLFFHHMFFFLILVCEEITRRESGWWDTDTCYISMATRDAPNHPRSSESNFWPDLVWHNNSRDYWTGKSILVYEGKITKLSIQFSYTKIFLFMLQNLGHNLMKVMNKNEKISWVLANQKEGDEKCLLITYLWNP